MNPITTRIALALVASSVLAGCQKYEDGPFISLRSREQRIANHWRLEKATDGGTDLTSIFTQYELELTRGGSATLWAMYDVGGFTVDFSTSGQWYLENQSEDLRLDFDDNNQDITYEILRLKEKELWLGEKNGDGELHLRPV